MLSKLYEWTEAVRRTWLHVPKVLWCIRKDTNQVVEMQLETSTKRKGRDLTQSYDKSPYTHRKILKTTWQHKNANKKFDYTTILNRLRTVSWSNDCHPTGVVKHAYEIPTFLLTSKAVYSKEHIPSEEIWTSPFI